MIIDQIHENCNCLAVLLALRRYLHNGKTVSAVADETTISFLENKKRTFADALLTPINKLTTMGC